MSKKKKCNIFYLLVNAVFYASSAAAMYQFCLLAKKWPELMMQWENCERQLPIYQTLKEKQRLANHTKLYGIAIVACAVIEHVLAIASSIHYVTTCKPNEDIILTYFNNDFTGIIRGTSYALWKAILAKLINIVGMMTLIFI